MLFVLGLVPLPAWANSFTWIGGTGDWTVSANWSPAGVPGGGDTATINSGSVTINDGEDIEVAEVNFSGGTLLIAGSLTIDQAMQWTGGTVNGSGLLDIPEGATLAVAGISTKTLSGSLIVINAGTILWSDGTFLVGSTAGIDNFGLFDITHTGNRSLGLLASSQTATLFNASTGIIRKREGIGTTLFETVFDFDNQGLVDVQSGTLRVRTQTVNAAQMNVASGAVLDFSSSFGVSHSHTPASMLGGGGEIRFSQVSTTISGGYTHSGLTRISGGTVTLAMASVDFPNLHFESGNLQGEVDITLSGDAIWQSGTLTGSGQVLVAKGSTLSLTGTSLKTLSNNRELLNQGTVLWSDGAFRVEGTARIDNFGLFDITHTGNQSLGLFANTQTATLFNDSTGIIRKREGIGTTTLQTVFDFDNQGLVDVQSGTLLVRTQTINTAEMNVASGAVLDFSSQFGVSHSHTKASTLSGAGELRFSQGSTTISGGYTHSGLTRINGGTVTLAMASVDFPDLRFESGTLQGEADITLSGDAIWQSGTLTGSGQVLITNPITLSLTGASQKTLANNRELLNQGTVLWSDGTFRVEGTARIDNIGLFDIIHALDRSLGLFASAQTATLFNDSTGIIRKREGIGTTTLDTVFDFDNQGLVDVHSGTLRVRSDTTHSGDLLVRADTLVEFTSNFGTTHSLTTSGRIGGLGEIRMTGGVEIMESTIAPGLPGSEETDPGSLTISPALQLTPVNVVEIRVGETAHDRIFTPGAAQLDGELEVILIGNSGPGGALFEIVSANQGVTGTFASLTTDDAPLPEPRVWEVLYESARALLFVGPDALFSDRFEQ